MVREVCLGGTRGWDACEETGDIAPPVASSSRLGKLATSGCRNRSPRRRHPAVPQGR